MLSRLPRVADALSSCYYEQATVSECILIPSVTLTCIIRTRFEPSPLPGYTSSNNTADVGCGLSGESSESTRGFMP